MLHDAVKAYIDRNIHHNFMDNYGIFTTLKYDSDIQVNVVVSKI